MPRLYVLPLGEACCDKGRVLTPGVGEGTRIHIPITAYLLRTDGGRIVVIDTGIHRSHVDDPDRTWGGTELGALLRPVMRPEDTVDFRLAQLGLRGTDVTDVVNTHLHFDHAGNNDAFPNATFHLQREHLEAATDNPSFPNHYWRLPHLRYRLLDGETDLGDDVMVWPTPGHAPGHQSVRVQLPRDGAFVICGDAIYDADNVRHDSWGGHADPVAARRSAHDLLERARGWRATVFYGHDPEQRRTARTLPLFYE
ncbi:MAG TPA: N-acyl homoserine lactonase family protein [Candidatus Micrarchaeia archaeon]|nr:N-acyl homoserine lactonase family protein [Candidatus Micrarchaeia archaeon]